MVTESLIKAPNTCPAPTISSSYHQVRCNDILFSIVKIVFFCAVSITVLQTTTRHLVPYCFVLLTFIRWIQLSFGVYDWSPEVWPFQIKATEEYFPVVLFILLYKVVQSFEFVGQILKYDHLRTVPTIVIAHMFCASPDTRISYRQCLLIQGSFCAA